MRFPATVILVLCVLLLTSCFRRVPEELPPQEVLRRTILNTIMLEAVNIEAVATLAGTVSGSSLSASLALTGTLAPLKHAWVINLGGTITGPMQSPITTRLELAELSSGDIYLRVDELQSAGHVLEPAASGSILGQRVGFSGSIVGKLMRIVRGTVSQSLPLGPDPRLVDAYASAIDILSGGLRQMPDGSYVYHYSVHANPAILGSVQKSGKQMTITGDLTIDSGSFALLRAHWTLSSVPSALGPIDATVDIRFHDHNVARLSLPALTGSDVRIRNEDDLYRFPSMGIEEP